METGWAKPPHLRADLDYSPIPAAFFKAAAGDTPDWDLRRVHHTDLIPVEQAELVQDMPVLPKLQEIRRCEARACISLC